MRKSYKVFILILGFSVISSSAEASLIDDLRSKISDRSKEIEKLDQEIKLFQTEVESAKRQAGTLQGEITQINSTQKKLSTDLSKTEKDISSTAKQIVKIDQEIDLTGRRIAEQKKALAQAIRSFRETEAVSLIEIALSAQSLSGLLSDNQSLERLNSQIDQAINNLESSQQLLGSKRTDAEKAKADLAAAKARLADQKALVDQTRKSKDLLLATTKNKEANYQQLLQDRIAKKQSVQAEIRKIEEELRVVIDPSSLPKTGSGVLGWPLDQVTITQYFGNTEFASKNPQLYNGKGHNGVDLRASIGTLTRSAADGKVIGVGDTDNTCSGASYGKWILVRHNNGLTTLYAHLSLIKVSEGQEVKRGEIIGYTGNTGYSTGPHLHFTVYASQGVSVGSLQSKVPGCGVYRLPLASYNSYLNPLSYL